jgi:hypothetical protein
MAHNSSAFAAQQEHVYVPLDPSDRKHAASFTLDDYEALWFARQLREYSYYDAADSDRSEIAVAYASHMSAEVKDNGQPYSTLFAHSDTALDVLFSALEYARDEADARFPNGIADRIEIELRALIGEEHD